MPCTGDTAVPVELMHTEPAPSPSPAASAVTLAPPAVPSRRPMPAPGPGAEVFPPFAGGRTLARNAESGTPEPPPATGADDEPERAAESTPGGGGAALHTEPAPEAESPQPVTGGPHSAPVEDFAAQYSDAAWLALLDGEPQPRADAAPEADRAGDDAGAAEEGAPSSEIPAGAEAAPASGTEAMPGADADAEEIARQLERIAARLRDGQDLERWVGAAAGDPLELLLAGVVLGYTRGRRSGAAADRTP
jgi:hypothetical protein